MSHPQPSMPPRQFSPPQPSPSPSTTTAGFALPPNKRTKMSPGPVSQPASPYPNSPHPYAASPGATTPGASTPSANLTSPAPPTFPLNNQQHPPSSYPTSHTTNGRPASATMSLTMPSATPTPSLPSPLPATPNDTHAHAPYSNATLAPMSAPSATPATGMMGPPTIAPSSFTSANDAARQASKPATTKTATYDMDDMLVGTGIDLEEEAEIMNSMESRNGFSQYPPGGRSSFYGAGPANQPAQQTNAITQEDLAAEAADRAWNEAAMRLAVTRSQEMAHHLLKPGNLHKKMHDTVQKYGLGLNLDLKPDGKSQYIGRMANPNDFPKPEIKVMVQKAPDGTIVQTTGSFIPKEAYLVDQIALLSIGTKERLRDLIGDANKIATTRQQTSHGVIPVEWADAAAPQPLKVNGTHGDSPRTGAESAVSPRTNPLKRPADDISNGLPTPVSEASPPNFMVEAALGVGKIAQNSEEARLKKRQKMLEKGDKDKDNADGSRAGSAAPGTPGSIAPEAELKAPTKKEGKKAAAKAAEAASSTNVNQTLGLFAGGKKKKYSWMNAGTAGSGASTPRAQGSGASGNTGGVAGASSRIARGPLTKSSVQHLGQLREDSIKGKNIQLRDWVVVLEDRGFNSKALQEAYGRLEKSDWGDKVADKTP